MHNLFEHLPERLNWKQACGLLMCKKDKFYAMINQGKLTAYRVGAKGLWVSKVECLRLIEKAE